jgi:hypothetical protein
MLTYTSEVVNNKSTRKDESQREISHDDQEFDEATKFTEDLSHMRNLKELKESNDEQLMTIRDMSSEIASTIRDSSFPNASLKLPSNKSSREVVQSVDKDYLDIIGLYLDKTKVSFILKMHNSERSVKSQISHDFDTRFASVSDELVPIENRLSCNGE